MTTVEVKGLWMKRYRSLYVSLFLFHTKTKDAFRESLIYCTLWLFGAGTMVVRTYYDTVCWNFFIQNGGTFTFATVLVQTLNSRYDILNDLNLLMITSWYACRYIRPVFTKTNYCSDALNWTQFNRQDLYYFYEKIDPSVVLAYDFKLGLFWFCFMWNYPFPKPYKIKITKRNIMY